MFPGVKGTGWRRPVPGCCDDAVLLTPQTVYVPSDDGVEVAVHDYGGAGHPGRPMVFVHGTGLSSRMWEPVISRLPAGTIRPLAVDLRGHGATRTPAGVTFFDHRMVADLTAVCRAFDLRGAWIAAHSMGGGTALLTEARAPGTFERLWVFEPIIFPRVRTADDPVSVFVEATRRRRPVFASREEAYERYASRPPLDECDPEALRAYVTHGFVEQPDGTVRLACDPAQEAAAFEQYLQDGWDELPSIAAPVLVGHGAKTTDPSGPWSPQIAARLPNGVAEEFPDSAHFGPFGDIEGTTASIVRWFLDR